MNTSKPVFTSADVQPFTLSSEMNLAEKDVLIVMNSAEFEKVTKTIGSPLLNIIKENPTPDGLKEDFNFALYQYLSNRNLLPPSALTTYVTTDDFVSYIRDEESVQEVFISLDLTKLNPKQRNAALALIYNMTAEDGKGIGKKLKFIVHADQIPNELISISGIYFTGTE
ncbi:MAG: hypothetical protein UT34_C0001G0417 [candidate division WS6 bacterium GW2011_GWF2_39_15]|uniref:Uncharacterized protein n=1 Tax=candidate division WS6 bacterium GW2011_GWF2_39_15 TaxID=1619100 RepID=A0A0G0QXL1_9BACT|nr:MAG: hypothetical protein UT34_C0001G0417 [candidate division WS6 bacterium GW2011_GWF2_39_15]